MIIYQIRNLVNGKIYIGQSQKSFEERYKNGRWWAKTTNTHLKNAAKKYGIENFLVEILESDVSSVELLNKLEEEYIKNLNCVEPNGYNVMSGGKNAKASRDCILQRAMKRRKVKNIYLKNQKTGEIVEAETMADFCKERDLSPTNINLVVNGKVTSHKYWTLPDVVMKYWVLKHRDGKEEKVFSGEGHLFLKKYGLSDKAFGKMQNGFCVDGWIISFLQPTINGRGRIRKKCKNLDKMLNGENSHEEIYIYIKDILTGIEKRFMKVPGYLDLILAEFDMRNKAGAERLANGHIEIYKKRFIKTKEERLVIG